MSEYSPMMNQFLNIKASHQDEILFYRLGDFYEMFFDDAIIASKELNLTLTGRDCGMGERAPMCGVPHHSCEAYMARLVAKGYKVAICDQVEAADASKGVVKREVVRVITPGTVIEENMLEEGRPNYLAVITKNDSDFGICFMDISTGELKVTDITDDKSMTKLISELMCNQPREILVNFSLEKHNDFVKTIKNKFDTRFDDSLLELFNKQTVEPVILSHFNAVNSSEINLDFNSLSFISVGVGIHYVKNVSLATIESVNKIEQYSALQYMMLDFNTRKNLELLTNSSNNGKKGTLISILDKTSTSMGKRKLTKVIEQPMLNLVHINNRLDCVEELILKKQLCDQLDELLSGILDIERIITRIAGGSTNARELVGFKNAIKNIPQIKEITQKFISSGIVAMSKEIDTLEDIYSLLENAIEDDPPVAIKEGGIIKTGYDSEIDVVRADVTGGKDILFELEQREKQKTGIKNLKIGYNKVFGYYIEITNSYKDTVPEYYIRKQTLSNCERFITDELKLLESRIIGANDRIVVLEYKVFDLVRKKVAENTLRVQATANAIAALDVLISFAKVSFNNNYVRPLLNNDGVISIIDGRHPVVETLTDDPFVPNDTNMDIKHNRMSIITGPNMAGKSTYMRQVALIALMAQIGCFVPAKSANISITDAIFTRVGANDNLAAGQSTFMVEMNEVAYILKHATKNSLIIYDEVGRGTSTFDGMSIAQAVLEHTNNKNKIGAKTLFATHYHELSILENTIEGIKNYNIAAKKTKDGIVFLRRIVSGAADDSYGIEVAKLAGVPNEVIKRANDILMELESKERKEYIPKKTNTVQEGAVQDSFYLNQSNKIVDELSAIDVNILSPIESLGLLNSLIEKAKAAK